MDQDYAGRVVVVTGGTGALGSAVVKLLLERGAICHATGHLGSGKNQPNPHKNLHLHPVDCTDEKAVTDFYAKVGPMWASIHTIGGFSAAPIEQTRADDFRRQFELNTLSCFLCCREAIVAMRKTGQGGRIVNVAARAAVAPTSGMIAYATAKSAVAALTQSLAKETRDDQIWINAVLPSIMDTPANRTSMSDADYSRWPTVEQVARTIAFLASPDNALTSGALVPDYGLA
ncbi:MAG: SDR family NAD(P)-dependent oxidoreductase [Phycisphaerales bacterium]|jgi:NAD(P)-dependent dehydrogenase (short-subunit alcohol dehydrogenase family)|nr:SDR family NAD(P)-dependent oxidoreductase [Phycisphaerales bacterium]